MKKRFNIGYWLILGGLIFGSCSVKNEHCVLETEVLLYAHFCDTLQKDKTLSFVSIHGLDNDSLLYDSVKVSKIALPLKPNLTQTDYVLTIENDSTQACDTLSFRHDNSQWFLSLECGSIVTHRLTQATATKHYIDSLKIMNEDIKNENSIHVKLYVTP